MKVRTGLFLAALAAAILPATALADKVDVKLNAEMPKIMEYLRSKNYQNVGVLRFQVQKGKGNPSFDNAPFNGNMPTRMETLLVIHGGPVENKALGVINDAGKTANAEKIGDWFGSETERKKLFEPSYPLAWGKKTVKADAFLTGLVKSDAAMKKTTFTISCFSKDDLKPRVIREFTLDTNTDILRDLGCSYVLSRGAQANLAKIAKRSFAKIDEYTQESTQENGELTNDDPKPIKDKAKVSKKKEETTAKPSDIAGLEVVLFVDGKEYDFTNSEKGWELKCPPTGKTLAFRLHNTTQKRLGVVMKLNGFSTFNNQNVSPEKCRKWIIEPGKKPSIKGFMLPENEEDYEAGKDVKMAVQPFKVLVGDDAKKMAERFGDKAAWLEIDVFHEGETIANEEDSLVVSARGLPPEKDKLLRASYKALRPALLKSANLQPTMVAKRELIVPDTTAIKKYLNVKVADFTGGYSVGRLAVKIVPAAE
jgi:hypothetical protein